MKLKLTLALSVLFVLNLNATVIEVENKYSYPFSVAVIFSGRYLDQPLGIDTNQKHTIALPSLPSHVEFEFNFGISTPYDIPDRTIRPVIRTTSYIQNIGYKCIVHSPSTIQFVAP